MIIEDVPISLVLIHRLVHLALVVRVFRAVTAEERGTIHEARTLKLHTTVVAGLVGLGHGGIIPFFFPAGQLLCCTPEAQKLGRIAGPVDLTASNAHGGDKLDLDTLGLVGLGHGGILPHQRVNLQPLDLNLIPFLLSQLPLGALHLPLGITLATTGVLLHLAALALRDLVHGVIICQVRERDQVPCYLFFSVLLC